MLDKSLIHNRFAKNLESYNKNAKIQKKMSERLITFVTNKAPRKILEIGCGTGFLTKQISINLDFEKCIALDIVAECEPYIRDINPQIIFTAADVEVFLKNCDETFDLIISNASLQWVEDFEEVINNLKNILNPNGELIFSTFGNENFREIYHVIGTTLNYYSYSELARILPGAVIEPEIHVMAFNNPKEVLRHLQQTGVNAIESIHWTKKDLVKFERGYMSLCNRIPTLTYNPVYIKIVK